MLVRRALMGCAGLFWAPMAYGQVLTTDLEIKLIPSVGGTWQTVSLENSYTDPIVICTYNLPSSSDAPGLTRVQNVTPSSFELKIQKFINSGAVTASSVHCIIADEGAYNSGGLKFEARKVLSTGTNKKSKWQSTLTEDVTSAVIQSYTAPVTIGQVMTANDAQASAFWSHDCDKRGNPAFDTGMGDGICVGKHTAKTPSARNDEMLGYMVIESGTGSVNDISFAAAIGPNTVKGVGNSPGYNYAVSGDFEIGVASNAAENGGDGSWTILYGPDPLSANQITLAVDEDDVVNSTNRAHIDEEVAYWIFDINQTAKLEAKKGVSMYSGNTSSYAIPGSDVIYTIKASNGGSGPVDNDSVFLVDSLPPEITFYNGDIDDGGPLTGVVDFDAGDSGLTFNEATDLGFSNSATKPTNFAACSYSPSAGYDPNVTFICFNPSGTMSEGVFTSSVFAVSFRAAVE